MKVCVSVNGAGAMIGITNIADRFRGLPHHADSRYPHDGRHPDFKRVGPNGREHCHRGFRAATGWTRSAVIADRRDFRFTRRGMCYLFPKLDTFVQILVRKDVSRCGTIRVRPVHFPKLVHAWVDRPGGLSYSSVSGSTSMTSAVADHFRSRANDCARRNRSLSAVRLAALIRN